MWTLPAADRQQCTSHLCLSLSCCDVLNVPVCLIVRLASWLSWVYNFDVTRDKITTFLLEMSLADDDLNCDIWGKVC